MNTGVSRRCNAGPDRKSFVITQLLVGIPIALFFALLARVLWQEISWIAVVVMGVLGLLTFGSLLTAGCTDPGIVPRNEPASIPDMRTAVYIINGHEIITKYCTTCHLYRPPRCSHCAVCDNCIEKFDHHCPWVGKCIGRRNYRPFLMFIFSCSLSCAMMITLCAIRLAHLVHDGQFAQSMRTGWAAIALILWCTAGLLFVGALSGFHTYLLATNQTTYEYFRGRGADNTFQRAMPSNCAEAICGATRLYAHYPNGHPSLVRPPQPGSCLGDVSQLAQYDASLGGISVLDRRHRSSELHPPHRVHASATMTHAIPAEKLSASSTSNDVGSPCSKTGRVDACSSAQTTNRAASTDGSNIERV